MTGHDIDDDFIAQALPAFISEAKEQCDGLEHLLLQLEDSPADRELLDALFRCAHTVKGSAGLFGLDEVTGFTHHVESLLDRLREGQLRLTPALSTVLLQCNDEIRLLVAAAEGEQSPDATSSARRSELVVRLQAGAGPADAIETGAKAGSRGATAEPSATARCWRLAVRFGADTFRNGMDPAAILDYLRGLGRMSALVCDTAAVPALEDGDPESCQLGFTLELHGPASRENVEAAFDFVRDDCSVQLEEVVGTATTAPNTNEDPDADSHPAAHAEKSVATAPAKGDDTRFIRVQADRLDAVINLLGELVTACAGASLLARGTRKGPLIDAHQQISELVEDVRTGTLQLRMVPIGETFARFRRVVRDTASALGKDVVLDIVGGDTELDKSLVERIADPLTHLVRNALDHGLETAQQREAAGKHAQGRLTLSARHESGSVLIRISDDGRGIRRDKVLARARQQGLVAPGQTPTDDEVLDLIFRPGFSTAEAVTQLSGRGVGMDVVRRNIEALRGSVTVHSEPGRGSNIDIRLPLTLAIIDGFLVGVGRSRFILPLDNVEEVIESRPNAVACDANGRGVVELRGAMLPVVSLRQLYALDGPEPARSSVVVVQSGNLRCGVLVDALYGQHQTVIKPLGRMFRMLRGFSGSTILGNGEVALILDVSALHQLAADSSARASHPPLLTAPAEQATPEYSEGPIA